jgi:hypothetical protein
MHVVCSCEFIVSLHYLDAQDKLQSLELLQSNTFAQVERLRKRMEELCALSPAREEDDDEAVVSTQELVKRKRTTTLSTVD